MVQWECKLVGSSEPEHETNKVVTRTHVVGGVVFTATGPEAAVEQTVDKITRALDWYDALASEVRRRREEKRQRGTQLAASAREELAS